MDQIHNEKGVALSIILVIITVFSILGLTVIGYIINNAQTFNKTETTVQSYDIAEMGLKYNEALFNNFYPEKMKAIETSIKQQIAEDMKQNTYEDSITYTNTYEQQIAKQLEVQIEEYLRSNEFNKLSPDGAMKKVILSTEPDQHFIISVDNIEKSIDCITCNKIDKGETLAFTYKSTGYTDDGVERTVKATRYIEIETLAINVNHSDEKNEETENPPNEPNNESTYDHIIKEPEKLLPCPDNTSIGAKSCVYSNTEDLNGKSTITGVEIVLEGNLEADFNINQNINNSTLYVKGNAKFNKPIGAIQNRSQIYIDGNADFFNINSIDNSIIVVTGSATFKKKFNMANSAEIYIRKSIDLQGKNVVVKNNSKICVGGDVKNHKPGVNVYSPTINQQEFETHCTLPTYMPDNIDFSMDYDSTEITYEYN